MEKYTINSSAYEFDFYNISKWSKLSLISKFAFLIYFELDEY